LDGFIFFSWWTPVANGR